MGERGLRASQLCLPIREEETAVLQSTAIKATNWNPIYKLWSTQLQLLGLVYLLSQFLYVTTCSITTAYSINGIYPSALNSVFFSVVVTYFPKISIDIKWKLSIFKLIKHDIFTAYHYTGLIKLSTLIELNTFCCKPFWEKYCHYKKHFTAAIPDFQSKYLKIKSKKIEWHLQKYM